MREKITRKNNVALRERKLKNGDLSLYLMTFRNGKHEYEFLKLYINSRPRTADDRAANKDTYALAEKIRTVKQSELDHNSYGFTPPHKQKVNLHDFIRQYIARYDKTDKRMVECSYTRFVDFLTEYHPKLAKSLRAPQLTKPLVEEYKDYLLSRGEGEGPLSYFKRFKKIIYAAIDEKILTDNPAKGVVCRADEGLRKDILSMEEIERLARTKCGNDEVKRAFLFCCYSGIRFCDIRKLTYKNIDFENNRLQFEQSKTKGHSSSSLVSLDMSPMMRMLIGEKGKHKNGDLVFRLPSHNGALSALKHWTKRAEIDKHITWHCARHSFAVLMLNEGKTDVKTLSGLLGQSGLKYVEKYTRVIDERKRDALNSLPAITVSG